MSGRITLDGDVLTQVQQGLEASATTLESSTPALSTAIGPDAFGLAGSGVAAAGNLLGSAFAGLAGVTATFARLTAEGVGLTHDDFRRLEEEAASAFSSVELGGHR